MCRPVGLDGVICVTAEAAAPGTRVEVEFFGEWVEGLVAAEPLWDPKGERIRA